MMLNNILRWTTILSVFSIFIIPFLVANDLFFPFITGKGFFFRIVVEIGFAAWLLLSMRDASVRPRKSVLLWAFVAFLAVIGLANILGENPWKSFWSNFERMEGYITLVHLFLYFLVASSTLASEKIWMRFLQTSVWTSLVISLYGVMQLSGKIVINQGGVRVDATFGNATYLAIFLIFNIFFALILIVREREMWKKVSYSLITILNIVILYYTATRGSALGLLGGLLLSGILIALFDRDNKNMRIAFGSIAAIVILVIVGFMAIKDSQFVKGSTVLSRFSSISVRDTKTQARAYIWPMAIEGFKEKPILGWGQDNFNYIFNERYNPKMWNQEQWFDHTHNIVLDWLVAGGILGLLAYLSLYVAAIYLLWKRVTDITFTEKALITGLGAAYFFHNLFVFDNLVSYMYFASVLALIQYRSTRLEKPVAADREEMDDSDLRLAGPIILVGLIFALYFFNYRGYATGRHLIEALRAANSGPQAAQIIVDSYEKALSYDSLGHSEVVERLVESAQTVNNSNVPIELRERFKSMGTKAVEGQIERYKDDARYEMFAGNFYAVYGEMDKALPHYEKAAELSPNKQAILFQLGSAYVAMRQYDKAVEVFQHAYELEPNNPDALRYYSASLIYLGKEAEAKALLNSAGVTPSDDMLISAYADTGKWDKVIDILKVKIAAEPTKQEHWMNLVAAYYQSGNKGQAVATLRQMIANNPDFKTQGEQYIREIQAGQ